MLIHFDLLDKLYLRIANNLRHHGWRQLVLHFTFSSRLCTMKMEQRKLLINIINNKGKHTIQQFTYEQVKQNLECSNKSNNMLTGQEHQADRHGYSGKLNMTIQSLHFFLATTLKLKSECPGNPRVTSTTLPTYSHQKFKECVLASTL
ncbi:unnamed protein product, partial [Vitis vinifera]